MYRRLAGVIVMAALAALTAPRLGAQALGTFSWQLQPYCNVVMLNVHQEGALYRLQGIDDQCGAGPHASVTGLAFPNPDGSIGFGLTIVTVPGGRSLHVDATITLDTLGGTWRDSEKQTGAFVYTPGPGAGGSPRPTPSATAGPPGPT